MGGRNIDLVAIGTVAYDSVSTPFGKEEGILGGSVVHFAGSASFFSNVGIVAAVGNDFDLRELSFLSERNVDLSGISVLDGKTFRWEGSYGYDLNLALTIKTELNVLEIFKPEIPDHFRSAKFVFLANIDPELQASCLEQIGNRGNFVALDTMNFWIEKKRDVLLDVIRRVQMVVINEAELREMTLEHNLIKASKMVISMGPEVVVVKRGEYGVLMVKKDEVFLCPAFPLEDVFDPTGAGDTFAGGLLGYLANVRSVTDETLKQGIIMGSVMASFNVEDFGVKRIRNLSLKEIGERYRSFKRCIEFKDLDLWS